jgi:acyl-CoA synthetase (AMP-forming)/AMP-acid ligase II
METLEGAGEMNLKPNFDLGKAEEAILTAKQLTVGDILKKKALLTPGRIALQWGKKIWSFKVLNDETNKLANRFLDLGIKRGDRITVLSQNRAECSHILYAAAKIGAIVAFLNWRYSENEIVEAIHIITSETIIVSGEYVRKVESVMTQLPYVKRKILLDELDPKETNSTYYYFHELLDEGDSSEPSVDLHEEDPLFIVYTSGTTGPPKGATVSHRGEIQRMIAHFANFPLLLHVTEDDVYVARDPFCHMASIDSMFATHAMGGKVIVLAGFNPQELVDIMVEEKIGWLCLAPGMYDRLISEIKSRDKGIKSLKAIGAMADMLSQDTIRDITRITNAPFFNTYGLTEIGMHNFSQNVLPIGTDETVYESMAKSEGIFCDVRLVNSEGEDVRDGEPGELIIRSSMIFNGYWNNSAINEEVFRGGWFYTGDVLVRTPNGRLDFVSRRKYMIKSGGENIYPAEIERVLFSHPKIREAVVVGTFHPKWGETPIAFVAVSEPVAEEQLKEFCRVNGLAKYKIPNVIEPVKMEDFPRNENGKVLREKIEQWIVRVRERII